MRYKTLGVGMLCGVVLVAATSAARGQGATEVFNTTASVKTASGATATAPVTMTVLRKMSKDEADKLVGAFRTGGAAGLQKALVGVAPTGSVQVGNGQPTPSRITIERPVGGGRLLTIITDRPVMFLGAGLPGAPAKQGYDFAVVDLQIDAAGAGSGTMAPAATIKIDEQGAFVVQDYSAELVRLTVTRKGT
jgi:hypothetical protein